MQIWLMQLLLSRKQATLTHSTSIQFYVLSASWLRWSVSWPPTAIANKTARVVFYAAKKRIAAY